MRMLNKIQNKIMEPRNTANFTDSIQLPIYLLEEAEVKPALGQYLWEEVEVKLALWAVSVEEIEVNSSLGGGGGEVSTVGVSVEEVEVKPALGGGRAEVCTGAVPVGGVETELFGQCLTESPLKEVLGVAV